MYRKIQINGSQTCTKIKEDNSFGSLKKSIISAKNKKRFGRRRTLNEPSQSSETSRYIYRETLPKTFLEFR